MITMDAETSRLSTEARKDGLAPRELFARFCRLVGHAEAAARMS